MQLMQRQSDGAPLRAHLEAAARAGDTPDPRLHAEPPQGGAALWAAFVDLAAARPAGMGPGGIPASEIVAWQRLYGVRLSPWEAETLQAMDRAALAAMAEKKGGVQ